MNGRPLFLVWLAACATTDGAEGSSRELPLGLRSMRALLEGCATEVDGDVTTARCPGDVTLSLRTRVAIAGEPSYRSDAYDLARESGARLVWDQITVPTEGPSGVLDRARAMTPLDDTPKGVLLGAVRSLGKRDVQDVWCIARDDAGDRRCRDLLGGVLGSQLEAQPRPGEGTTRASSPPSAGPATLFGRALSLPSSCRASPQAAGGDVTCEDGATGSWRRFDTMDEATETMSGTLAALGTDEEDAEPFSCTLGGEPAQCEEREGVLAGVAYVDGKPVAVLCAARSPRKHPLCRALLHEK